MRPQRTRPALAIVAGGALAALALAALSAPAGRALAPRHSGTQLGGRLVATWPVTQQAWPFEPLDIGVAAGGRLYVADGASGEVLIYGRDGQLIERIERGVLGGSGALACDHIPVPVALEIDGPRDLLHVKLYREFARRFNEAGLVGTRDRTCRMTYSLSTRQAVAKLETLAGDRTDLALLPDGVVLEATWFDGSYRVGTSTVAPPWARVGVLPDGQRIVPRTESLELLNPQGKVLRRIELPGLEPIAPVALPGGRLYLLARPTAPDAAGPVVVVLDPATGLEVNRLPAGPGWPHPPRSGWPWALAVNGDEVAFTTAVGQQFAVARFTADGQPLGVVLGGPLRAAPLPRTAYAARQVQRPLDIGVADDGTVITLDRGSGEITRRTDGGAGQSVQLLVHGLDTAIAPNGSALYALSGDGWVAALSPSGQPIWRTALAVDAGARIAADAGRVYVSLPAAQRVVVLDAVTGAPDGERVSPADGPLWPADIAAVGDGSLVVLNPDGRTVVVLAADGTETARLGVALSGSVARLAAARVQGQLRIAALTSDGWVELHDTQLGLLGRWLAVDEQGKGVPASDVALDDAGRVFVTDSALPAIRVYDPVPDAPLPTPSPTPTGRPTPSGTRCVVTGDKRVGPTRVMLGESATVTLTLAADCPGQPRLLGADVVLVLDHSASMVDDKLAAASADAAALAALLTARGYRVALAPFAEVAALASPLDAPPGALLGPLAALSPDGLTLVAAGLRAAETELVARGRAEALPVVVLLSDGVSTVDTGEPLADAANALRARGIVAFALGYGRDAWLQQLATVTGDPAHVWHPPSPTDLAALTAAIERTVADSLAGNWIIEDEMGVNIHFLPHSGRPAPILQGNRATWIRPVLPRGGITLTYRVQPRRVGRLPVNQLAVARFVDADGSPGEYVFPVPEIEVWQPTATPTPTNTPAPIDTPTPVPAPLFLPLLQKEECLREYMHVVLALDTSTSMGVPMVPGGETKIAAARRAIQVFLGELRGERDSAALVRFDRSASVVAAGRDPAALLAALEGLTLVSGTRIDLGLATARQAVSAGLTRPGGRAVVVLLSDGDPDAGTENATLAEAGQLLDRGIPVYTVAVGPDADRQLLRLIAGQPQRSFVVTSGDELVALYRTLGQGLDPCVGRR